MNNKRSKNLLNPLLLIAAVTGLVSLSACSGGVKAFGTQAAQPGAALSHDNSSGTVTSAASSLLLSLQSQVISDSEIDLSWQGPSLSGATFVLERRDSNGSAAFVRIAAPAAGANSYKDTGLKHPWQYDYRIKAVQGSQVSNYATILNVLVADGVSGATAAASTAGVACAAPPVCPSSGAVSAGSSCAYGMPSFQTDVSGCVKSCQVVVSCTLNATTVSSPSPTPSTTSSGTGGSAASPLAPATLQASISSAASEIDLSWADTNAGKAQYVVQRRDSNGSSTYTTIATLPAGVTSYKNTGLNALWRYDYGVYAVSAATESPEAYISNLMTNAAGGTGGSSSTPPANTASAPPASCSNYNVHPGDDIASVANKAGANATLCFAPGQYTVNGNGANASHIPGAGRKYVGSGKAAFVGGPSDAKLALDAGGEIYGFTFQKVMLSIEGSGESIHDNHFVGALNDGGTATAIYLNPSASNTSIAYNTFSDGGIFPTSGDDTTIDHNGFYFTVDGSHPAGYNNQEAIHIVGRITNLSITQNVILGQRLRWGIELQEGMHHLRVLNNYLQSNVGGYISCATGGDAAPPYANQGEDIEIGGNTLVSFSKTGSCGIEIMGDKQIVLDGNFIYGMGTAILNGSGGLNGGAPQSSHNTYVVDDAFSNEQFLWAVPNVISANDAVFKKDAAGAPVPGPAPTGVGSRL